MQIRSGKDTKLIILLQNDKRELFSLIFIIAFLIISAFFIRNLILNCFVNRRFQDKGISIWFLNRCIRKIEYERIKEIVICAGATRYGNRVDKHGIEKAYVFLLSKRTIICQTLCYDGALPLGISDSDILLVFPLEFMNIDMLLSNTIAPIIISGRIYDLNKEDFENHVIQHKERVIVTESI